MLAMVLERTAPAEEAPLKPCERPDPQPGPRELVVRVHACGVCHTDLHVVEGDLELPRLPIIPGHEIVGVVERRGAECSRWEIGQRVAMPWLYSTCGRCKFCRMECENLCAEAQFTGFHADGGFAELVLAQEDFVYELPEGIGDVHAAPLMCAGVIGLRALRQAEADQAEYLGLYGFGASAHIAIQVARYWGCEVFVFTRSPEHQEHARELGAAWVGRAEDEAPARLDSAIIFAPAGPLVPLALGALERGGTVALAGIHMSPIPEMEYALIYGERTMRSVANSTREDVVNLLQLAAEIPLRTDVETLPLAEANEALRWVKNSEVSGAVVLTMED